MKNISIGGICSIFSILVVSIDSEAYNVDESGFIAGDYIIGALFPIHKWYNQSSYDEGIKDIDEYEGIQIAEAAFFAVDLINKNESILPNISLGLDIRDFQEKYLEAVEQSVNLLNYASDEKEPNFKDLFSSIQNNSRPPLLGIIGPADFRQVAEVQHFLNAFSIIQIAYSGPQAHVHENNWSYSFAPGYQHLTEAIVDILLLYNWNYVSLVYSTPTLDPNLSEMLFWEAGKKAFESIAYRDKKICIDSIVNGFELKYFYKNFDEYLEEAFENVSVIVCYCTLETKLQLFRVLNRLRSFGSRKRFVVVGKYYEFLTDSYLSELQSSDVGEIALREKPTYIEEFDNYFLSRNLRNNERNPWFFEFWEHHFECSFKQDVKDVKNRKTCSGEEVLSRKDYKQNPKVVQVIKSVFLLAHGLHRLTQQGCHSEKLPFRVLDKSCYAYNTEYVQFDFDGKRFEFQSKYSLPIEYDILNLQHLENGSYDYVKIGEFETVNSDLELSKQNFSYDFVKDGTYRVYHFTDVLHYEMKKLTHLQNATLVRSTCGEPCSPKQMKVMKDKCHWDCVDCGPLEVMKNKTTCHKCDSGFMSNPYKTKCVPIPMERIEWHDSRTFVLLVGSALNIILTVFTTCIFIMYRQTPVVKASTVELCYIMLIGNFAANLTTFILTLVPSIVSCVLVRTLPPFSFAFIYAALVVKTNRIAETLAISKKKFPRFKSRFRPKVMVAITLILIFVQVLPCLLSLYKHPIKPEEKLLQKPDSSYYIFKMCPLEEDILLELFAYSGVLKLFCTYYAFKTRNVAENYNEAKFIAFAMYATISTNVAFAWVLAHVGYEIKVITLTLCILVNSLVLWSLLFAPKLYVILWAPEKNTKEHFKTTADIRCFIGGQQQKTNSLQIESRNQSQEKKCEDEVAEFRH